MSGVGHVLLTASASAGPCWQPTCRLLLGLLWQQGEVLTNSRTLDPSRVFACCRFSNGGDERLLVLWRLASAITGAQILVYVRQELENGDQFNLQLDPRLLLTFSDGYR